MANIPRVLPHKIGGRVYIIIQTSASKWEDGFDGAYWTACDGSTGDKFSWGYSEGINKTGAAASLMAIKNAKAACKRYDNRKWW